MSATSPAARPAVGHAAADRCPGVLRLAVAADGHLARIRLPGGLIGAGQMRVLAQLAGELGDGRVELTSRGNVQLRGLAADATGSLTDQLIQVGLLPSLSHERVRNVLASPLAGLDGGRDLTAIVRALDARLCARPRLAELSGRFLFAVDDGRGDVAGLGADVVAQVQPDSAVVNGLIVDQGGAADDAVVTVMLACAEAFLDEAATQGGTVWRIADLADGAERVRAAVAARLRLAAAPQPPGTRATGTAGSAARPVATAGPAARAAGPAARAAGPAGRSAGPAGRPVGDQASWRWIFFLNVPVGAVAAFFVSVLVEDPPWEKNRRSRGIDYIGLSLITIGLGCLEIMMDRGEDADWFQSDFIRLMALLAFLGISGAIGWLLIARKPIVDLSVFADRNFAGGCVMIGATGAILYASAVLIPQLAQTVLMYTATWAGLILSPGGIAVIILIPFIGRLMTKVQLRFIIATGFTIIGCALVYSSTLVPDIDFKTLVFMRTFQTAGLAFLFVPISTVAYTTLPRELNGDGAALFAMFRNIFGSVGIALATAQVTQRSQVHQSYLAQWTSPLNQPFQALVAQYEQTLRAMGRVGAAAHDAAVGRVYQVFRTQAAILGYRDVFFDCAIVAFLIVPLCFLLSPKTGGMRAGGGH